MFRKKSYNIQITYSKPSLASKVVIEKRVKVRNIKKYIKRLKKKRIFPNIDTDIKIIGEINV